MSDRSHFVQIDDRTSESENVRFVVPQGSILGPMSFNLYFSDLQDHLPSSIGSFQYADDITIYYSPAPELQRSGQELNSARNTVSSWSNDSHLALNPKKTKTMLLSTIQMSHIHSLDKNRPAITISDSTLELCKCKYKNLGVHFHQHLNWDEHVQATCKSCSGTIQIIRKLKNFLPIMDSEALNGVTGAVKT